jgi:hypothetical protein
MLSGMSCSWAEIQSLIINPTTGNPICKDTLSRYFRRELQTGNIQLKRLGIAKYHEALRKGAPYAVRLFMRNKLGWISEGTTPVPIEVTGELKNEGIQIRFIAGPGSQPQPSPLDVTPAPAPSPYEGQPADLSRPAIEAPRERQETKYGTYEYPRAEQPPSIFDRGSPRSWMK